MRSRVAVAAALFGVATASHAGLFFVDSFADLPDATPNGVCAASGGACTLRAAIQEANANAENDTIELPSGTIALAVAGAGEDLAATGDLDVASGQAVTILGQGVGASRINATGIDRVFDVRGGASLLVRDATITGGATNELGGGFVVFGALTLDRVRVEGNVANAGGGIWVGPEAVLTLVDTMITDNRAGNFGFTNADGGAILSRGSVFMRSSTLFANRAENSGSAIWAEGDLDLQDSTLSGNLLSVVAVVLQNAGGRLAHVTIHDNFGQGVSAFSFDGSHALVIANTIVSAGIGYPACNLTSTSSPPALTFQGNNLSSDASCLFTQAGSLQNTDPALLALADNGGPTLTHLPAGGSPVRDGGGSVGCTVADQRGEPRPQDGDGDTIAVCDIGAIEAPEPRGIPLGGAALGALALLRPRSRQPSLG